MVTVLFSVAFGLVVILGALGIVMLWIGLTPPTYLDDLDASERAQELREVK